MDGNLGVDDDIDLDVDLDADLALDSDILSIRNSVEICTECNNKSQGIVAELNRNSY